MDQSQPPGLLAPLPRWQALLLAAAAVGAFQLAFVPGFGGVILLFLLAVWFLAVRCPFSGRVTFYGGIVFGFGLYAFPLGFFWAVFGAGAIVLWLVLAFWVSLFFSLVRQCRLRFGPMVAAMLVPFLWTGLEYFRGELYYLRFTWMAPGYALADETLGGSLLHAGVYGVSFLFLALASGLVLCWQRPLGAILVASVAVVLVWWLTTLGSKDSSVRSKNLRVAGVQMEFPGLAEVRVGLDHLTARYPDADVLVLSEYTFDGPVPDRIIKWCRDRRRYLVVGGKEPVPGGDFRNTAYVIGPDGKVVFQQTKAVPIQFFKDGRPAEQQRVWDSPWGKLGICICYDLSYTRVVDRLVRQGAQGLIVPTMDVESWGQRQHDLHARVAPVRAAEYGLPIFRLASSGISQVVGPDAKVLASAPFPGAEALISGELELAGAGRLPLDRWVGPGCVVVTILAAIAAALNGWDQRMQSQVLMKRQTYAQSLR